MMIRKNDIQNDDCRWRQVVSGSDDIQKAASVMSWRRYSAGETVVTENLDEMHGCRIIGTIQSNVQVTRNVNCSNDRQKCSFSSGSGVEDFIIICMIVQFAASSNSVEILSQCNHRKAHILQGTVAY